MQVLEAFLIGIRSPLLVRCAKGKECLLQNQMEVKEVLSTEHIRNTENTLR